MSIRVKPDNIIDIKIMMPDILVNLSYATKDNFTGQIVPGYEDNISFMSTEAAMALRLAHNEAKSFGLNFKIFDSYRPITAVEFFYNNWRLQEDQPEMKQRFYPYLTKEDLFQIGYVATRSSHSRASTADLTLVDLKTNEELDMGTEFDYFGEESHTAYKNISAEQKRNRLLLKSLMEKNGFVNFKNEWWHFRLENEPYQNGFDFLVKKASL